MCLSFSTFVSYSVDAQLITPMKTADTRLNKMVNSINTYNRFIGKDLNVTILEIANEAGSAKQPETDEVSTDIYIGVAEPDLAPKRTLYRIKNVYGASNFTMDNSEVGVLWISFDYFDRISSPAVRKKVTIKLTLTTAVVVK